MKRFLDLADFSRDEVVDLIALARRLETHPEPQALAGKILGLLFMNPSLRTLSSFQAGMMRLGGTSFVVTPGQGTWNVETRDGVVQLAGSVASAAMKDKAGRITAAIDGVKSVDNVLVVRPR